MCGIAGYFGGSPSDGFTGHALVALARRGPDGNGVWQSEDESVALIHTRLAILDLTAAGSQPMVWAGEQRSDDGTHQSVGGQKAAWNRGQGEATASLSDHQLSTLNNQLPKYVLVFNGEIYNFRELRRELEAVGEIFTGDGDTEVLLRRLVREGEACLSKLAGMFAFAFWDIERAEALLARDPLGIKPLYYREGAGSLSFASETKVLCRGDDAIDSQALRNYFLWGSLPEPQTIHLLTRQLKAGHLLKWKNGEVHTECWYCPVRCVAAIVTEKYRVFWKGLSAPAKVTRVALEESMVRHLVSDVPIGIFLSGGIDSTVVLALARRILGKDADIRTFSIGFSDPEFDESSIARRTAEHFGAHHTEWMMTAEEGCAEIPGYLNAMDQPGIDGFNTWCVSKLAETEGMKVVMSGLGGDEIFAGYSSFMRVPRFLQLYKTLRVLRGVAATLLQTKPTGSPWLRLADFLWGGGECLHAYHAQRGIFTLAEADALVAKMGGNSLPDMDWELPGLPLDPREMVAQLEVCRYMRNQLLRDSDVNSMAHSLELRVPFVDSRLIETVSKIPASIRLRQGKKLLIEAVPEIPEWVINQQKRGFRFPFQQWLEGNFGHLLVSAREISPVELNSWYRVWAVAAFVDHVKTGDKHQG